MKNKRFFIGFILLVAFRAFGNPVMPRCLNELYFSPDGWVLELNTNGFSLYLENCLLATPSDTARFITQLEVNWNTYVLVTPDSLDHRLNIRPSGDTLTLYDPDHHVIDRFEYTSHMHGCSLNRMQIASYIYLDRTPTLGSANDTTGAMGWIQGTITDETGLPLPGVNIHWRYYYLDNYVEYSDSLGRFQLRALSGNVDYFFTLAGYQRSIRWIMTYPDCTVVVNVVMKKDLQVVGTEAWRTESETILSDNYPNPFNAVTYFRFVLPFDGFTEIGVYDIRGRLLEILYKGYQRKGEYRLFWNAFEAPSGIYFCRMQTDHSVRIKKWLLVR